MEDGFEETKSFKDLGICDQLIEACDNLGWKNPSKIQVEAIPHALEGKDLIGLAQTGSGKTGAFALPILQALLENQHAFFACILSRTREMAIQIGEQFEALGSTINVRCAVAMACFIIHCGWNSTIEAISSGVPLLCWPYIADQFFNQSYICDVWKVGVALDRDERGIIMRNEIKNKVDQLLGDDKFKVSMVLKWCFTMAMQVPLIC